MRPENPHTHLDANGTPYEHAHAPADAHLDAVSVPYIHVIDPDRDPNADVTITTSTTEGGGWYVLHPRAGNVLR